jgi:hypothetical protein
VIIYTCRRPYSHRSGTNFIVTFAVVLKGPVLCSWMLVATPMWSSIFLIKTIATPSVAMPVILLKVLGLAILRKFCYLRVIQQTCKSILE